MVSDFLATTGGASVEMKRLYVYMAAGELTMHPDLPLDKPKELMYFSRDSTTVMLCHRKFCRLHVGRRWCAKEPLTVLRCLCLR